MVLRGAVVVIALVLVPFAAGAQTTRQQVLQAQREQKAQSLEPHEPNGLERWILKIENERTLERLLASSEGLRPRLGSFRRGGGIAAGPGYRRSRLFGGEVDFSAWGAISTKRYWMIEAAATMPRIGERFFAELHARRLDFPEEDFFGIGPESRRSSEASYAYRSTELGGTIGVRPGRRLNVGFDAEALHPSIGHGRDGPSVDEIVSVVETPGLREQPDFFRYELFADLDYSDPSGNPRAGGRYLVSYQRFQDRDLDRYSFGRFEIDARQYLSILQQRRVLALRALVSMSNADSGHDVPFYFQRTLGGSDTLRGFREFRFRGRHLLLLQAEYRWEIFPALDAALFYDAGKVAPDARDLDFHRLESDYGFGFRFGTRRGVFLRIDAAFGSDDGKHFWLRFGHAF